MEEIAFQCTSLALSLWSLRTGLERVFGDQMTVLLYMLDLVCQGETEMVVVVVVLEGCKLPRFTASILILGFHHN